MNQENSKALHRAAMRHSQEAYMALERGDEPTAFRFYEQAFELEKQAANQYLLTFDQEPTRSVLFRSAANLAMKCGKYEAVQTMVHFGLAGKPPKEIVQELVAVYDLAQNALQQLPLPTTNQVTNAENHFWFKGILTVADARQHQITIVSDDQKVAKIKVPKELNGIVRNYWNEVVNVCLLKQGKLLTLVEVEQIFLQKSA
jgi:hypothetical protein